MATNTKPVGVAFSDPQLDGAIMGTATGTAGFFGTTPVTKPSTALTTTAIASLTTTTVCAMTTTQLATLQTTVNTICATLTTLGLNA